MFSFENSCFSVFQQLIDQFGFRRGRRTTEAIGSLRTLVERCTE